MSNSYICAKKVWDSGSVYSGYLDFKDGNLCSREIAVT